MIGSILAISPSSEGDGGWVPVEKLCPPSERADDDPSIWVLYSKRMMEGERFLVRFPEMPTYRYLEEGALQIEAGSGAFSLIVRKEGEESQDLHYELDGKWVHEHFVKSPHHFYHFRVVSDQSNSDLSDAFFSSFSIEKNR